MSSTDAQLLSWLETPQTAEIKPLTFLKANIGSLNQRQQQKLDSGQNEIVSRECKASLREDKVARVERVFHQVMKQESISKSPYASSLDQALSYVVRKQMLMGDPELAFEDLKTQRREQDATSQGYRENLAKIQNLKSEIEKTIQQIELTKETLNLRIVPHDEHLNVFDVYIDDQLLAPGVKREQLSQSVQPLELLCRRSSKKVRQYQAQFISNLCQK